MQVADADQDVVFPSILRKGCFQCLHIVGVDGANRQKGGSIQLKQRKGMFKQLANQVLAVEQLRAFAGTDDSSSRVTDHNRISSLFQDRVREFFSGESRVMAFSLRQIGYAHVEAIGYPVVINLADRQVNRYMGPVRGSHSQHREMGAGRFGTQQRSQFRPTCCSKPAMYFTADQLLDRDPEDRGEVLVGT